MVRVENLMNRDVVMADRNASVYSVSLLMRVLNVGSVLVKDFTGIIGIVTEGDIVRKVVSQNRIPEFTPVHTIMSAPVINIDQDQSVFEAADLMQQSRTRHLAVTHDHDVVGVLSVRDLLHPVAIDDL